MLRSRNFLLVAMTTAACATLAPRPGVEDSIHLGNRWFAYRAAGLGMTVEDARTRDAGLSEQDVPSGIWDQQTAAEGAALWTTLCAPCHGVDGRVSKEMAATMDPAPREWGGLGPAMGFLFGGDAMRVGIYRSIRDGVIPEDPDAPQGMVGWGDKLSREQIWALVFHIESL